MITGFVPNLPGFTFHNLYDPVRLDDLTRIFFEESRPKDPTLFDRFDNYRAAGGAAFSAKEVSDLLVLVAPYVSSFVARLFGVEDECRSMVVAAEGESVIFRFKKEFFVRRALKRVTREQALAMDFEQLDARVAAVRASFSTVPRDDLELETAAIVMQLLAHEKYLKVTLPEETASFAKDLAGRLRAEQALPDIVPADTDESSLKKFLADVVSLFEQWTVASYYRGLPLTRDWATFTLPADFDFMHLVEAVRVEQPVPGAVIGPERTARRRDGFDLTDPRFSRRQVMSEVDYCIFCHARNKDSCSKGIRVATGYQKNPLGYTLEGCPLDQKISESQLLKGHGDSIAALAVIVVDNPMVPGTGHRICNDCMKACIYQKQDPVNIPQIETRILTDVLDLPWGFEIYSLLTRWNPLNIRRPHALPYNGRNVLVVGLGPAGYTLAHYFLNEGFGVAGIDGLKIEPLPAALAGNASTPFQPLRDFKSVATRLSERVMMGFGGVSEYGITARWDKNFLTVIYLNLIRQKHFRLFDGVRFGGTLKVEDAWKYGFDHVCIGTGAGKPVVVPVKNNLVRGVRQASDFLMALQLTGAGKASSMANLQVQLPAIVIGGGLTAIDTATEIMAYYPVQVTKIRDRYESLARHYGKEHVDAMFDEEERERLNFFLDHARQIDCERKRAAAVGEEPNFTPLLRKWGGVHIYYRKGMQDSPAYRLNHEEVIKSLQEGISFVGCMNPKELIPDERGAVKEMVFARTEQRDGKWVQTDDVYRVPARSVLVAAGTVPNIMYEREHPGTFALDEEEEFFKAFEKGPDGARLVRSEGTEKGFFTSYEKNGRYVTFYGDNHPDYAGNVVKAMASAKHGFRAVLSLFETGTLLQADSVSSPERERIWENLVAVLEDDLRARVVKVARLTPTITEVTVRAPKAAQEFHPGQFYRLQNYEVDSPVVDRTLVMMEGVALTGAWVDREKGLIGLIVLEVGVSSRLCAMLKPGQRVVLMGPTGTPTEIPANATVLLLGGGLGNAVLFSIARALKEKNSRVVYFAGYRRREDFFKREEIEASTDVVVYSVDRGDPIEVRRPRDRSFVGNIVDAMLAYAKGELSAAPIALSEADRIIAIGSDRMMAAVSQARHGVLKPYLKPEHSGIASINSPMQCMMKAICAQCLQRHVDPVTGREEFVFSCANQDQLMDHVDFSNLSARLRANSVMEKISNRWLDYILEKHPIHRV